MSEMTKTESMKMCILGGGGYLGQCLARDLQAEGHSIVMLDLNFAIFPNINVDWKNVKIIKGSILDRTKLEEALNGCVACFHLAAYGMSGGASLNEKMTNLVNIGGTNLVIEACVKAKCRRLLYTSTVAVTFGNEEVFNQDETAPYLTEFLTPYAKSKCIAEQKVLQEGKNGTLETCALRLRGIYGPGEIRSTQKTVDMITKGFIRATFSKSEPCLSQYSSAENTSLALRKAEISLRIGHKSPTNGNAYNILDGGEAVSNIGFWFPLFSCVKAPLPAFKIPYYFVYFIAFISEWLYFLFKLEPLLTRFEVNLLALTNTYSIEKAKADFGYDPKNNHCLKATIQYYENAKTTTTMTLKKQTLKTTRKWKQEFLLSEQFWSKLITLLAFTLITSFMYPFLSDALFVVERNLTMI
uniref:3-beta hydroxysteroid dehydrogenase/isomerase domain-containing protein n=1 Tax=Panagrolaimus sp. PS1159 TaxID=55785 RepID=A0AC35GPJ4_9BILA